MSVHNYTMEILEAVAEAANNGGINKVIKKVNDDYEIVDKDIKEMFEHRQEMLDKMLYFIGYTNQEIIYAIGSSIDFVTSGGALKTATINKLNASASKNEIYNATLLIINYIIERATNDSAYRFFTDENGEIHITDKKVSDLLSERETLTNKALKSNNPSKGALIIILVDAFNNSSNNIEEFKRLALIEINKYQ